MSAKKSTPRHDLSSAVVDSSMTAASTQSKSSITANQVSVQHGVIEGAYTGVEGWLMFFLIVFSIAALGHGWAFFGAVLLLSTSINLVTLVFSSLLFVGYIATVVTIVMQKRVGWVLAWVVLAMSAVYSVVSATIGYLVASDAAHTLQAGPQYEQSARSALESVSDSLPMVIGSVVVSLVVHGAIALYFMRSRRVKATLVR